MMANLRVFENVTSVAEARASLAGSILSGALQRSGSSRASIAEGFTARSGFRLGSFIVDRLAAVMVLGS